MESSSKLNRFDKVLIPSRPYGIANILIEFFVSLFPIAKPPYLISKLEELRATLKSLLVIIFITVVIGILASATNVAYDLFLLCVLIICWICAHQLAQRHLVKEDIDDVKRSIAILTKRKSTTLSSITDGVEKPNTQPPTSKQFLLEQNEAQKVTSSTGLSSFLGDCQASSLEIDSHHHQSRIKNEESYGGGGLQNGIADREVTTIGSLSETSCLEAQKLDQLKSIVCDEKTKADESSSETDLSQDPCLLFASTLSPTLSMPSSSLPSVVLPHDDDFESGLVPSLNCCGVKETETSTQSCTLCLRIDTATAAATASAAAAAAVVEGDGIDVVASPESSKCTPSIVNKPESRTECDQRTLLEEQIFYGNANLDIQDVKSTAQVAPQMLKTEVSSPGLTRMAPASGVPQTSFDIFLTGGPAMVLESSVTALKAFLGKACISSSGAEEMRLLLTESAINLCDEVIRLSHLPQVDILDRDPFLPDVEVEFTDAIPLQSMLIHGNFIWDFIHRIFSLLSSAGWVIPNRTWPYFKDSAPDHHAKHLLTVSVLNLLLGTSLKIIDFGLQLYDKSMHPQTLKPGLAPTAPPVLACLADNRHIASDFSDDEFQLKSDQTTVVKMESSFEPYLSCLDLDLTLISRTLYQLQVLFFSVVSPAGAADPSRSEQICFIERLVRGYLLIGSENALLLSKEAADTHLECFSVESVVRCLKTSKRSPIAPRYWDEIERLYRITLEEGNDLNQSLRDSLWPILIDYRVQRKMYTAALQLLDAQRQCGRSMPEHIAPAVIELGVKCKRMDLIESEIQKQKPLLTIHSYMQVIRAFSHRSDVSGALNVLEQLEKDERVDADNFAYNSVLDVCVSNGNLAAAGTLFCHMREIGNLDTITFNIMIKGCIRQKPPRLESAYEFLQLMSALQFTPDGVSYNSIIGAAVAINEMDFAWRLVDEMENNQIQIDRYTRSILIRHLRPSSTPRDKRRTFALMDSVNVCEDCVLFSTIVDACARLKDHRRLHRVLEEFNRSRLCPNVHAYGTLIKAYGRCRNVDKAWNLWKEMTEERHLKPTSYTYGCMFDTLVSDGRVEEGINLLNESLAKGEEPNTVHYSILIKGCAQKRQIDRALSLYQEMLDRGVECNEVAFNTLINACTSAGDLEKAELILQHMQKSLTCKPDVITYSTLIKGFCSVGEVHRAFSLFDKMEAENIAPDAIVFNTLLEGCARMLLVDSAEKVFRRMLSSNVPPSSFTLTILIKLYGRTQRLNRALRLAEELPNQYGFECDGYVYTCLIAACVTNRQVDTALTFFHKMNVGETRSVVTGRTYGTIVLGCLKAYRFLTSYNLCIDAYDRRMELDPKIINRLHQSFVDENQQICQVVNHQPDLVEFISLITFWLSQKVAHQDYGDPPRFPSAMRPAIESAERLINNARLLSQDDQNNFYRAKSSLMASKFRKGQRLGEVVTRHHFAPPPACLLPPPLSEVNVPRIHSTPATFPQQKYYHQSF